MNDVRPISLTGGRHHNVNAPRYKTHRAARSSFDMGWKATHVRLRGKHRTVYKGLSDCHDKAQGIAERISISANRRWSLC